MDQKLDECVLMEDPLTMNYSVITHPAQGHSLFLLKHTDVTARMINIDLCVEGASLA